MLNFSHQNLLRDFSSFFFLFEVEILVGFFIYLNPRGRFIIGINVKSQKLKKFKPYILARQQVPFSTGIFLVL